MQGRIRELERQANLPPLLQNILGDSAGLTPGGSGTHVQPQESLQALSIHLLPGDPNANGGLDADGNYVVYLDGPLLGPSSGDTAVLSQARLVDTTSGAGPLLADAAKSVGFIQKYTSAGWALYYPVLASAVANTVIVKTGGTGYPSATSGADIFPGTLLSSCSFDDTSSTNTLVSSTGDVIKILSLSGSYIPTGTTLLALAIQGTTSSGKKHYVVRFEDAIVGIGKTSGACAKGGSCTIDVYFDSATATGSTISAYNLFGDIGATKFVAWITVNGQAYLIAAEC